MLRRFEWIRDGGYFDGFRWDSSLPDFERINVVYGNNGAGKSSLARVLDGVRSTSDGHQKISVALEDNGNQRLTNGQTDPFYSRVLVFSDDYVARSHRLHGSDADMDAVLTLGQRTVEDEEQLGKLRTEQQKLTDERTELYGEKRKAEGERDSAYTRVSRAVVSDASRAGGMYASRGNYNVTKVKTRLAQLQGQLAALPADDLAAKKQLISGDNKDPLTTSSFSLTIRADLVGAARRLLAETPVTIVLDTLHAHPEASSWVQEGVRLHRDQSVCAFCRGPVTGERLRQIEQHFSDGVARLQGELGDLDGELSKAEDEADALAQGIPDGGLLFADLRQQFEQDSQVVRDQVVGFKQWCGELRAKLTTKQANVLVMVENDLAEPPAIDGSALSKTRDEHNERVSSHALLVEEAARAVERHHLHSEAAQIAASRARLEAIDGRLVQIKTRLDELATEIPALETAEGDPAPSAQVLTTEVARLLGRQELKFEASGKRYRVLRDGSPATGLSVGERTAITLVHFMETVARFDISGGKPIVVIDDPVSSLDSNVFMGISTYIWSQAVSLTTDHIDQLFLLTHNFELFRQWDIQLEGLHKNDGLRKAFPAELYELRSHHVSAAGTQRRRPILQKWPESPAVRKKMRSSYHHAFMLMVKAHEDLQDNDTVENRLDAQLLFPNLIRRVLESFLAFKQPGFAGDFTGAMRKTTAMLEDAGYQGDADALRQQLTRYTHAYSHSETPDTREVINPDEIAVALAAVFSFMRALDEGHFCGLCKAVGVEPDALVPPASEDDAA